MRSFVVVGLFVVVLLSGCDGSEVISADEVPVSLSLASSSELINSASKNGGHVEFSSAKLLVREIQFHARDEASDGDSLDFRTESLVINLRTDSVVTEVAVESIPIGVYHKVSFRIHKPDEDETPPDPDFKTGQSGQERYSVIVDGQFGDAPFTYRSSKAMHQTISLPEDLVIDGSETEPINLTLLVDLDAWFVGNGGQELDPNSTSNGTISQIDKSIRDSFRLFKDRDRDGRDDG
jgi:hypothetical protein